MISFDDVVIVFAFVFVEFCRMCRMWCGFDYGWSDVDIPFDVTAEYFTFKE